MRLDVFCQIWWKKNPNKHHDCCNQQNVPQRLLFIKLGNSNEIMSAWFKRQMERVAHVEKNYTKMHAGSFVDPKPKQRQVDNWTTKIKRQYKYTIFAKSKKKKCTQLLIENFLTKTNGAVQHYLFVLSVIKMAFSFSNTSTLSLVIFSVPDSPASPTSNLQGAGSSDPDDRE